MSGNLHRLGGGVVRRERAAWAGPCRVGGCGEPVTAVIETVAGPRGICEGHVPQAERLGYPLRREPLEGSRGASPDA